MTPYIFTGLLPINQLAFINKVDEPIINLICSITGVPVKQVKSPTRKREVVTTRFLICYFLHHKTKHSKRKIGSLLGDRDHSTVIYNINQCKALKEFDKAFRELFERVESAITKMSDNSEY